MKNPRVDEYIKSAQPFARPILKKIRAIVHATVPEVTEDIKWGMPAFGYKGMFAGMAAFKKHCAFGVWRHRSIEALAGYEFGKDAMGSFGCLMSVDDLPSDTELRKILRAAKKLHDDGVREPKRKVTPPKNRVVVVPLALKKALAANKKAAAVFAAFPYSHKKEYVEWIVEAKRDETRDRRVVQAIEWLEAGKSRNWKYER